MTLGTLFSLFPADQRRPGHSVLLPSLPNIHACHFPCSPGTLSLDGEILKMSSGPGASRPLLRWALSTSQEPVSPVLADAISPEDSSESQSHWLWGSECFGDSGNISTCMSQY